MQPSPRPGGEARRRFASSKFAPPATSPAWVARPHLLDRLDAVDECGLAVVVGSPGSGKSSLLAQWSARRDQARSCWLNADGGDRDGVRFWVAFVTAVAGVEPGFGAACLDLLELDGTADAAFLESLLDAAERLTAPVVVVVDDFHQVAPVVAEQLRSVLSRGFGQIRVVLGSRQEPRVGIERRRLGAGLVELREVDLRLDRREAAAVLDGLDVRVRSDDLDILVERTEGWVAGVQMAALALRDVERPDQFVAGLSGTAGIISHYLWSEVFAAQPADVQRFLLDTAVADELTHGLAAALSPGNSVGLFDIESANLLIHRLDPAGTSFRYHHLLVDMLRARLRATAPEHEFVLHARAARWLAEHGSPAAAFRHQWWAGQRAEAISSIHGDFLDAYFADDLPSLAGTEGSLTDDDVVAAPGPAVSFCIALIVNGLAEEAQRLAARIETIAGARLSADERTQLVAVRTIESIVRCDTRTTIRAGEELRQRIAAGGGGDWSRLGLSALLRAYTWEGDTAAADGIADVLVGDEVTALERIELRSAIAQHRLLSGRLGDAAELASAALTESATRGVSDASVDLLATAVVGVTLLERGDTAAAEELLRDVSAADSRFRVLAGVLARLGLSRLGLSRGNLDAASGALDATGALLRRAPRDSAVLDRVRAERVRVLLAGGDRDAAEQVAATIDRALPRGLASCRIALSAGAVDDADAALTPIRHVPSNDAQRLEVAVTGLAIALAAGRGIDDAAAAVFDLAARNGHVFTLAEAGHQVLAAVQAAARHRPRTPYVDRLLLVTPHTRVAQVRGDVHPADALSNRELTVLRYLATSLSYREIAGQLYVSVNTVKTHAHNILRKLQVSSRADAVRRAQQLNYL